MSGNLDKSQHAPTVPDILYSDDPLASGNPKHSITKPNIDQTLAPPAIFTRTPKIRQTRSKRARPIYSGEDPYTQTDREVELPNPNVSIPTNPSAPGSTASTMDDDEDMENTHETPKARRRRRDPQSSPTFTNFGESGSILQHQLNAQAAMATNNAILNTIEILSNEVNQLKDLVTTLVTTTTSLKNQNNDLKQGQTRLEQQIQKMGRAHREPAKHTATTPATSTNSQPVNPQRTQKQAPA